MWYVEKFLWEEIQAYKLWFKLCVDWLISGARHPNIKRLWLFWNTTELVINQRGTSLGGTGEWHQWCHCTDTALWRPSWEGWPAILSARWHCSPCWRSMAIPNPLPPQGWSIWLHTTCYSLYTTHYTLHTTPFTLQTTHYTLPTSHYKMTLHTIH